MTKATHTVTGAATQPVEPPSHVPAFFGHHGFMSPGIRLFRSIGFSAKSAWVSVAFLLPILLLGASLWSAASQNIDLSTKERLGIEYARALLPLLDAAQGRRRAATAKAADLDEQQQRVAKALEAVSAKEQALGATLGTKLAWQRAQTLQQALAANAISDTPVHTFATHTTYVSALLDLLNDVADRSALTLDPDVDTYYLMDAALFKQPQLIEVLGQMRGIGNAVLRSGTMLAAQRDQIASALAFARNYQTGLERSLKRAAAEDAHILAEVSMDDAAAGSARFASMVSEQLLGITPQGDAAAFVAQANQAIAAHYIGIGKVLNALDKRITERINRLQRELLTQLLISALGIAVAVYLLVAFYRVTQGGIAEVARQLEEVSKGNLTLRPRPWGRDEVALLMNTLAATLDALRRTVSAVRAGAGEIQTASTEVASASMDLSHRTEDSASHLQRTSAAMSQIAATVKLTADTARGASEMVGENAKVSARGGVVVEEVVKTMSSIRDSSSRIGDIIGTIDSIAFQTNILALNAAVEAARAGEAGRGFAVVASEVRALAQRAAAAAREIKVLISSSVDQVESGSRVVAEAGQTMREMVNNAERVKALIGEITVGAVEQTAGVKDISQSVDHLDAMTQQNSALVEQTAAAAASLSESAVRLNQEMAFFRLS